MRNFWSKATARGTAGSVILLGVTMKADGQAVLPPGATGANTTVAHGTILGGILPPGATMQPTHGTAIPKAAQAAGVGPLPGNPLPPGAVPVQGGGIFVVPPVSQQAGQPPMPQVPQSNVPPPGTIPITSNYTIPITSTETIPINATGDTQPSQNSETQTQAPTQSQGDAPPVESGNSSNN